METCVTIITVEDLIGVIVIRTEADFAVSLKRFFGSGGCKSFRWFGIKVFLILNIGLEHFFSFIFKSMLE
jgi:hypothetical protein